MEPTVALTPCERGRARNLDDGSCTTTRDARDLARTAGVYVDENDVIECESKADELVASARLARIGCVPREAPPPPCPARSVRIGAASACASADRGGTVDLATWSRAAAEHLCARLARSPVALTGPATIFEVEVQAVVPNNDLSLGYVRVKTKPNIPDGDLARMTRPIDDALRRLGGSANASDVSGAATCAASARRPISVP